MKTMTLLDIGACRGEFTDRWLEEHPDGSVICVEPDPMNVDTLHQKFNPDSRVQIVPHAVNNHGGSQTFYQGTAHTNGSLLKEAEAQRWLLREKAELESFEIECLKISDIILKFNIDMESCVLKLDIEGLEHLVLCDLLDHDLLPATIYMEDGCRKTIHKPEWAARVQFHDMIERIEIADRIYVEESDPAQLIDARMVRKFDNAGTECQIGYVPIKNHYSYKSLHDPSWALQRFEDAGINELVRVCGISDVACNLMMHPALDGIALWFEGPFLNRVVPLTVRERDVDNNLGRTVDKASHVFADMIQFNTTISDLVVGVPRLLFIGIDRDAPLKSMLIPLAVLSQWNFMESSLAPDLHRRLKSLYNALYAMGELRYNWKSRFHPAVEFCFMNEEAEGNKG